MRAITSLLLACFFALAASAQSKKDIRLYKIKGVTETTVMYEGGKETANYRSEVKKFDKDGNTIENITYNRDGSVRRKEAAKYVGKDKVEELVQDVNIQKKADDDNDDGAKYKHTTSKYNSNGDKTEEIWYNEKGAVIKKELYTYNARGDRLTETTYDAAGKVTRKIVYTYDAKGLKTDKKVYGPGDVLQKHVKYTYTY
jgi:lipopolysaccharide export LptBFGC system permease protein LptF